VRVVVPSGVVTESVISRTGLSPSAL